MIKLIEDGLAGVHGAQYTPTPSLSIGDNIVFSVLVEASERSNILLYSSDGVNTPFCEFDLATGTAGVPSFCTSAITSQGGGVYLIEISFTMGVDGRSSAFVIFLCNAFGGDESDTYYAGVPGDGLFINNWAWARNGGAPVAFVFSSIVGAILLSGPTATALTMGHPIFGTPTAGSLGVNTKIWIALMAQLAAYVAAHPIAVAYPGITFIPTSGNPYLRLTFLRAAASAFDLQNTTDYRGVFQVDVFWPAQQGELAALEAAESIINRAFPRSSVFIKEGVRVMLNEPPYCGPVMQEPPWIQIPVTIPYRALVNEA